jgi:hypothetical protein
MGLRVNASNCSFRAWVWIASSCLVRFKSRMRCGRAFVDDTGTEGTRTTFPAQCGTPITCLRVGHPSRYKIRHQGKANWLTVRAVSHLATEGRAWTPSPPRRPSAPTESGSVRLTVSAGQHRDGVLEIFLSANAARAIGLYAHHSIHCHVLLLSLSQRHFHLPQLTQHVELEDHNDEK